MNDNDPIPPNVTALLDAERNRPDVAHDVQARAQRRLEIALAMTGLAATAGAVATSALASAATQAVPEPSASVAKASVAKLGARPIVSIVASLAIGAAVGAGVHAELRPSPIAAPAVAPSTTANARARGDARPQPTLPASSVAPSSSVAATAPIPALNPSVSAVPNAPPHAVSLSSERLLLEGARTALARDDGAAAMVSLDRHATKFPNGELAEEREALAIQALVSMGRRDEARSRATRFQARYPLSMFAAAVDAALQ